jgi:hypothetical protein
MDGADRLAARTLRASLIGGLGMLLPLACCGCSLVIRGGNDLQTAGNRITNAAVWAKDELSGSSTAPAGTGANAGAEYLPSEDCSWENAKPNC